MLGYMWSPLINLSISIVHQIPIWRGSTIPQAAITVEGLSMYSMHWFILISISWMTWRENFPVVHKWLKADTDYWNISRPIRPVSAGTNNKLGVLSPQSHQYMGLWLFSFIELTGNIHFGQLLLWWGLLIVFRHGQTISRHGNYV